MSSYSDVLGHWTQRLRFLIGGMVGRVGTGHWARAILLPREGKVDWPKGSNSGPRLGGGGDACRLGMSCLGRVGRTWTFPPRSSGSPFSNSASVGCLHPCTSQSPDPLFSSPSSSPHCISNPVGRVSAACSAEVPLISTMNWDSSVSPLVVVVAVEAGGGVN